MTVIMSKIYTKSKNKQEKYILNVANIHITDII